jgi:hypothetical protein
MLLKALLMRLCHKRGRKPQVDFALKNRGVDGLFKDYIESKWIAGKRSFTQEVFDDLVRLEMIEREDPRGGLWLSLIEHVSGVANTFRCNLEKLTPPQNWHGYYAVSAHRKHFRAK